MSLFNFFRKNKRIKNEKYVSEAYQNEIINKAKKWYFDNARDYELVAILLKKEGLNQDQILDIQAKLKNHIKDMVQKTKEELDRGDLKIEVKPIDTNANVIQNIKELVDQNIGFGAFQMDRGAYDNALELFDKAIQLDKNASLAYANKGTLYARQKKYEEALVFYNKALEIEPTREEFLANKVSVLQNLGKQNEIVDTFKLILSYYPNNINALNDLGIHHAQLNELETALTYFDRLLDIQPDDQDAILNKLMALCKIDLKKAKEFHLNKIEFILDDKHHHLVSISFDSKGQRDEAVKHYDDMYQLSKDEKYILLKGNFYYTRDSQMAIQLYDQYLKTNPDNEEAKKHKSQLIETPESQEIFRILNKYKEYIIQFITMLTKGSHAPIAAYEKEDGSIIGFLYVPGDALVDLSPREAVNKMRIEFEKRLQEHTVKSYTIFYHTNLDVNQNHIVANDAEGLNAISIEYKSLHKNSGHVAIHYDFNGTNYDFQSIKELSASQNQQIWNTRLTPNKKYFTDVVEVKYEGITNEDQLKISKTYQGKVGDFWKCIMGIENHGNLTKSNIWSELIVAAFTFGKQIKIKEHHIYEYEDEVFKIKVISAQDKKDVVSFFPYLKTTNTYSVKNYNIIQWAHVECLEARIEGQLSNKVKIGYYATDYAQHDNQYNSKSNINIKISGLAIVMKSYETNAVSKMEKYTCGLFPYNNGGEDSFEFVGIVEQVKQVVFMSMSQFKGYIVSVNLENDTVTENPLVIDMFIHEQNMQIHNLSKGIKINGIVILQGEISN